MEQKSIFNSGIWKVFGVFSEDPQKIHYIKEISRKIILAPTSVRLYIKKLESKGIIKKEKGEIFSGYKADRENEDFVFYKKILNLINLKESELIKEITKNIYPNSIVLYGSFLRGEDIKDSDIDLFVLSKSKKRIETEKFEKILKRKIHLIIDSFKKIPKDLKSEILNGLVLQGYFEDG